MANKKRFRVGDIVRPVDDYDAEQCNSHVCGYCGTVVEVRSGEFVCEYTVDFGVRIEGSTHDCNDVCPGGTGRWFDDCELVLVSPADEQNDEPEISDVSSFDDLL